MKGRYNSKHFRPLLAAIFLLTFLALFITPAVSASIASDINNDSRVNAQEVIVTQLVDLLNLFPV